MLLKEHLTEKGFHYILTLYASINKGISKKVFQYFSDIKPIKKIITKLPNKLNPNWVSGFVAGDGSFVLGLRKQENNSKIFRIYYSFSVTQHSRDFNLIKLLTTFFDCGVAKIRYNKKTLRCDYLVQDINSIQNKIIPHFEKYSLNNIKELDFLDFKLVIDIIGSKKHLEIHNQVIITNIINRMNHKRN